MKGWHLSVFLTILALRTLQAFSTRPMSSLADFLQRRFEAPSCTHITIGNPAGDADSIVSAIGMAYVSSKNVTPIVSISKDDLATQRPETLLLFRLADLNLNHLCHLNDDLLNQEISATLVDHNKLTYSSKWKVKEIWDHHHDEGCHQDTCAPDQRHIAFENGEALVASTCTLVVEQWLKTLAGGKMDECLSLLLLGTILIDSINMLPEARKGTARDGNAIQNLVENTDWSSLSPFAREMLLIGPENKPNTDKFFKALQDAKFDENFWEPLSVRDALRLDYKNFMANQVKFGAATVLLPLESFCKKKNLSSGILDFMQDQKIDFLAVMLTSTNKDGLRRQLVVCGRNSFPLSNMIEYLINSEKASEVLNLEDAKLSIEGNAELSIACFEQRNSKASRKQVAPFMMEFFQGSSTSSL